MGKLLLLSGVLVSMWLPVRLARDPNPRRGLRRCLQYIFCYNAFYVFGALKIYPMIKH